MLDLELPLSEIPRVSILGYEENSIHHYIIYPKNETFDYQGQEAVEGRTPI